MRSRFGRVCFGVERHEKKSRLKIGRHGNISATCQQTRRVDEHAVVLRHRLVADAAAEVVKKAEERQKSSKERQK